MSLREKYQTGLKELEKHYMLGDDEEILRILPLVKNGKFLLVGPYGYGKSLYAYLIGRIFFGYTKDEMPVVQLMDELSVNDVFFDMDVASLMNGKEKISPRSIISAPFKFVNEFQRGNYRIYNTFLGLFSEGFITMRDKKFHTEDYLALLDANPFDSGSVNIPAALMDRITASVNMRSLQGEKIIEMGENDTDIDRIKSVLSVKLMKTLWKEVEKVNVPRSIHLLLTLIHSYFSSCVYGDKAVMDPMYVATLCSSCRYRTEPCSLLTEPLGQRWWKDSIRLAKARAYFQNRAEISADDIFEVAPYAIQHRVRVREHLRSMYSSREEWVRTSIENARKHLINIWIPAIKGDTKKWNEDPRTLGVLEGPANE